MVGSGITKADSFLDRRVSPQGLPPASFDAPMPVIGWMLKFLLHCILLYLLYLRTLASARAPHAINASSYHEPCPSPSSSPSSFSPFPRHILAPSLRSGLWSSHHSKCILTTYQTQTSRSWPATEAILSLPHKCPNQLQRWRMGLHGQSLLWMHL
jgi:hypothetical protein